MTWLSVHIVGIGWVAIAWALLIAVWGGIAYRRWQHPTVDRSEDAL